MMFGKGVLSLFLLAQSINTSTSFVSPNVFAHKSFAAKSVPSVVTKYQVAFVTANTRLFSDATEDAVETTPEPEGAVSEDVPELNGEEATAVETVEETETEAAETEEQEEAPAEVEASTEEESSEESEPAEPAPKPTPEREPFTAYVGNLPFDLEEPALREAIEVYGTVTKIVIPLDRYSGRSRGFAFVSFSTREELDAACDSFSGTEFSGRAVYINESLPKEQRGPRPAPRTSQPKGTKLYVGNIAFECTEDDITELFTGFGAVSDVYIPTYPQSGQPRGYAFVTIDDEGAVKAIEETNGALFQGRTITVDRSLPKGQKKEKVSRNEVKLYVGNLSFQTELDSLRSMFAEYGQIFDCYMPLDRDTGNPRGFAFVTMGPEDAERAADELDGYELDGRFIRVNEAQPKGYSMAAARNTDFGRYDDNEDDGGYEEEATFEDAAPEEMSDEGGEQDEELSS